MPALEFVDKTVRCAIEQTYGSAKIVNIVHVYWAGAPADELGTADLPTVAAAVANAWKNDLLPILSSNLTMTGVVAQDLSGPTAPGGVSGVTGSGGVTGASDSAQVACAMSWLIGRHYRGGHPRSYLGGIPTASRASNQQFTATFCNQVISAGTAFNAAIAATVIRAGALSHVTVHRYKGHAVLVPPVVDPIIGVACTTRVDTQRRRLGK